MPEFSNPTGSGCPGSGRDASELRAKGSGGLSSQERHRWPASPVVRKSVKQPQGSRVWADQGTAERGAVTGRRQDECRPLGERPPYPFFLTAASAIEVTDPGLALLPGDVIGLTIASDPRDRTLCVSLDRDRNDAAELRDVPIGGIVDLGDIFTGALPWPPAIEANLEPLVEEVRIDIKPGGSPNSINLGSNGTVAVAIFGNSSFDATTVDPLSPALAGATVAGRGTPMASSATSMSTASTNLVVHVSTDTLQLSERDVEAVLKGQTFDGRAVRATDSVRVMR